MACSCVGHKSFQILFHPIRQRFSLTESRDTVLLRLHFAEVLSKGTITSGTIWAGRRGGGGGGLEQNMATLTMWWGKWNVPFLNTVDFLLLKQTGEHKALIKSCIRTQGGCLVCSLVQAKATPSFVVLFLSPSRQMPEYYHKQTTTASFQILAIIQSTY